MIELFCKCVAALLLLDGLAFLPLFATFFGKLERDDFRRQTSALSWAVLALWLASALAMVSSSAWARLAGNIALWAIARHYFIDSRWSSIRRGGGAPGFMSHWVLFYLMLLQFASYLDGAGQLHRHVLQVMRVDFAVIMICAGVYKVLVGYLEGEGMEYGRANPLWGYHWRFFAASSPTSLHVRLLNFLGSTVEIGAGAMMLVGGIWAWLGALSISLGFVYVAAFIRLGRLAYLMMLLPCMFAPGFEQPLAVPFHLILPGAVLMALGGLCQAFLVALPLIKLTQYYNLFFQRQLPQPWQGWCTAFANRYPIIIWRVFTADVTNFFVRIYRRNAQGLEQTWIHEETTYNYSHWGNLWTKLRFLHVSESIAMVSVFTTLRYFPSQPQLFHSKLVAYARSLRPRLGPETVEVRFETVRIEKAESCFVYRPHMSYTVHLESGQVSEQVLDASCDFAAPARFSPVKETQAPGSYVSV